MRIPVVIVVKSELGVLITASVLLVIALFLWWSTTGMLRESVTLAQHALKTQCVFVMHTPVNASIVG